MLEYQPGIERASLTAKLASTRSKTRAVALRFIGKGRELTNKRAPPFLLEADIGTTLRWGEVANECHRCVPCKRRRMKQVENSVKLALRTMEQSEAVSNESYQMANVMI